MAARARTELGASAACQLHLRVTRHLIRSQDPRYRNDSKPRVPRHECEGAALRIHIRSFAFALVDLHL